MRYQLFKFIKPCAFLMCTAILQLTNTAHSQTIDNIKESRGVKANYIVRTKSTHLDTSTQAIFSSMEKSKRKIKKFNKVFNGFAGQLTAEEVRKLRASPSIESIEMDGIVSIDQVQYNAPWGLDRIDQAALPYNFSYSYKADGTGVTVYVLDTGINAKHIQFGGRVSSHNFSSIPNSNEADDDHGHGTHVAGIIASSDYGVAKKATLVSVKVLDRFGSGSTSIVLSGIEWVIANAKKPAIINMSMSSPPSAALDQAVENAVSAGITVVVAAGNQNDKACFRSPARTPSAITVSASNSKDQRAGFSNFGECVDIFAPGEEISSTSIGWENTKLSSLSGTSMAAPFVAGTAAVILQSKPNASPDFVTREILNSATPGIIKHLDKSNNLISTYPLLNSFKAMGGQDNDLPERPKTTTHVLDMNAVTRANAQWSASIDVYIRQPYIPHFNLSGTAITVEFRGGLFNQVIDTKTCIVDTWNGCQIRSRNFFYLLDKINAKVVDIKRHDIQYVRSENKIDSLEIRAPRTVIRNIFCNLFAFGRTCY